MRAFQSRLREMMHKKKLSQADLARLTGIDSNTISSYVSGYHEPIDEYLKRLAKILDCDPLWLLGFDGTEEDAEALCLKLFRALPVKERKVTLDYLQFVLERVKWKI